MLFVQEGIVKSNTKVSPQLSFIQTLQVCTKSWSRIFDEKLLDPKADKEFLKFVQKRKSSRGNEVTAQSIKPIKFPGSESLLETGSVGW